MSSAKWRLFCLRLNVLKFSYYITVKANLSAHSTLEWCLMDRVIIAEGESLIALYRSNAYRIADYWTTAMVADADPYWSLMNWYCGYYPCQIYLMVIGLIVDLCVSVRYCRNVLQDSDIICVDNAQQNSIFNDDQKNIRIPMKDKVTSNRHVSQMRVPLVAYHEPAESYSRLLELLYVFEHKTQYILFHAPYARVVVFWQ